MESNYNTKENRGEAFRTTLLILLASIPFWILISLQIIVYQRDFVGFWLKAPYYYPYSFAFAEFVALSCGTCIIWFIQPKHGSVNVLLVIAGILIGSLLNIALAPFPMSIGILGWIFSLILLVTLLIFKQFQLASFLVLITALIFPRCNFITFLPIIIIYLIIFYTQVTQNKPYYIFKKTLYIIPLLAIITIPYIFAVFTKLTPGLILPISYRDSIGKTSFGFYYQTVISQLSKSEKLDEYIGSIQEYGLAEGRHYEIIGFRDNHACFITEIRGEKGIAFADGCDNIHEYFMGEYQVRAFTKSGSSFFVIPKSRNGN